MRTHEQTDGHDECNRGLWHKGAYTNKPNTQVYCVGREHNLFISNSVHTNTTPEHHTLVC